MAPGQRVYRLPSEWKENTPMIYFLDATGTRNGRRLGRNEGLRLLDCHEGHWIQGDSLTMVRLRIHDLEYHGVVKLKWASFHPNADEFS